eukprot:9473607-Pyramimonas_sp.AAC.1
MRRWCIEKLMIGCALHRMETWLADQLLQDSVERPVLSAENVIQNWATFFIARRDRTVSGEPRTIADRVAWEKAAVVERAVKGQCVQLTLPLKVEQDNWQS